MYWTKVKVATISTCYRHWRWDDSIPVIEVGRCNVVCGNLYVVGGVVELPVLGRLGVGVDQNAVECVLT